MVQAGSRALVDVGGRQRPAVVRYVGPVATRPGIWIGIELDASNPANQGLGLNDGMVFGTRYFTCAPGCGLFVPPARVKPLPSQTHHDGPFPPSASTPLLRPRAATICSSNKLIRSSNGARRLSVTSLRSRDGALQLSNPEPRSTSPPPTTNPSRGRNRANAPSTSRADSPTNPTHNRFSSLRAQKLNQSNFKGHLSGLPVPESPPQLPST